MANPRAPHGRARRVLLHIGAPKTGTTYAQSRLTLNRRELAAHGVHLPTGSRLVTPESWHFKAALDLLGQDWGGAPGHAEGAWPKLVSAVHRTTGTVVISHEIFGAAKQRHVDRAIEELGHDAELHIVYSARDLGRQVPAAWQETVKQGRKWGYRKFLDKTVAGETWFARSFDLPAVLEAWGSTLPAEHLHVVTVPKTRGETLWLRYLEAFGIDPAWAPHDSERANESLGIPETMVLLALNRRMPRAQRRSVPYDELLRGMLGHESLVARGSLPVTLPPELHDWADEQAQRWRDWIAQRGVHVIGDLDELSMTRPEPGTRWHNPAKARPKEMLGAALDALESMTDEAARRPDPSRTLAARAREGVARVRGRA